MYDTPKKRFKITSGCVLLYLLISVIVSVFFLIPFIDTNTLFFDYDKVNNLSNILTILSMFLTFLFITLVFKKKLKLNLHWEKQSFSVKETDHFLFPVRPGHEHCLHTAFRHPFFPLPSIADRTVRVYTS